MFNTYVILMDELMENLRSNGESDGACMIRRRTELLDCAFT